MIFNKDSPENDDINLNILKNEDQALYDYIDQIIYSDRYNDGEYEYRHVIMPKAMYDTYIPSKFKGVLLSDKQWRSLGMCQSPGWIHYLIHKPEPHIFLFKRKMDNPIPSKEEKKPYKKRQIEKEPIKRIDSKKKQQKKQ